MVRGGNSVKILFIAFSFLILSGCYVRYPEVGVPSDRVRPTNWKGERPIRCCYVVHNIDTGLKDYDCQTMYPSECRALHRSKR